MQLEIHFQVADMRRAMPLLRREVESPQALLGNIGETLLNINKGRHRQGVDPDGNPWAPLSPLTLGTAVWKKQAESFRRKRAMSMATARNIQKRRGGRILHNRGDMLRDFTCQVQGNTLQLGFSSALAKHHHFGTGIHGPKGAPYTIRPVNKKALSFAGIVVKRVNHPGIPARRLIGFPKSDQDAVKRTTQSHFDTLLKMGK